jgi:RimJ/RimL family protein N-acetyltransferase
MSTINTSLIIGAHVVVRDQQPADIDAFLTMQCSGEWLRWDAPWENPTNPLTAEEEIRFRTQFLENCAKEKPEPRKTAVIAIHTGQPIGMVNRYNLPAHPDAWFVGIDIFADDFLNRGLGTEALRLWVDYLFLHSSIHRISLDTWSFNPRMMRVAQKLGFTYEGAQREMQCWQGQWLDLVHYGQLRSEWEALYRGNGGRHD